MLLNYFFFSLCYNIKCVYYIETNVYFHIRKFLNTDILSNFRFNKKYATYYIFSIICDFYNIFYIM